MADLPLVFNLRARDAASDTFKTVSNSATGVGKKLGNGSGPTT